MFSNDSSNDEIKARQSRWGSLISQLEDKWDEDEDGGDGDENGNGIAPGISSGTGMGFALGSMTTGGGCGPSPWAGAARVSPTPRLDALKLLPSEKVKKSSLSTPFSGWSASRKMGVVAGEELSLADWVASHRYETLVNEDTIQPMEIAKKKKVYLEELAHVLHSLVSKIVGESKKGGGSSDDEIAIHPNFITAANVLVSKSFAGHISADFIECGDSIFFKEGGEDETKKKNLALNALGRMAYDMVMLGEGPSVTTFCSATNETSVSNALNIHDQGMMSDADDSINAFNENDILDMLRKNPRLTTSEEKDGRGLVATMLDADIPFPLARFVSDLLNDEHGSMFRSDLSFSSLDDVLSDLEQMMDNPEAFLHASSPDRWKLSFGEKLYGREDDTKAFMDAAERVFSIRDDPIFEGLSKLKGKRREVIMVSGHSGAGKSRLVRSCGVFLEQKGWRLMRCKFDRVVHPEPLSIIAYAFDEYFLSLSADPNSRGKHEICEHLKRSINSRGLEILSKHIPSLRLLLGVDYPRRTIEVNETMMASLFGKLIQALSSKRTPILFFIDDLQWADPLSLALITALIKGEGTDLLSWYHSSAKEGQTQDSSEEHTNVMFVASYRDNEVDDAHPLATVLSLLESDKKVNVTNISLSRFTLETMNKMLSETLCLPIRRVRSLSELVIQKTDGQPLHVIEFIQALTMDNLLTHSFARGWEWDADSIEICPMTDSVAELFTYKLQRLPKNILLGLQILSLFGSQIDQQVISFVADYDGENSVDIPGAITVALGNGFIEQAARLVSFSHDMIQKATLDSIQGDDLIPLLRKLAAALIKNASAVGDLDSVLFVVVDLINRIGSDATTCPKQRMQFADLNLRAGTKAIMVPDYTAAAKYTECGIAFLNDDNWETQYDLSLHLYENAVVSNFSNQHGNRDHLKERIDAVFKHGKTFSDKFRTHCVWVKLLSMTDMSKAIVESLKALERLGEPLDLADVDLGVVGQELMTLKNKFSGTKEKIPLSLNRLTLSNKERAMEVMASLCLYYHQQKSILAPYISCKMVKMTMAYGHCEHSVFGAAAFAAVLVNTLEDIDEGTAWGNAALSLMNLYDKEALMPSIYGPLYGLVFIWKEPFQLQLEPLAQGIRSSFAQGNVESAYVNTVFYISRSFLSGKNIRVLMGEVQALARQHGNNFGSIIDKPLHSPLLQFHLTPAYNTLSELEGVDGTPDEEISSSVSSPIDKFISLSTDDIMMTTIQANQAGALHIIVCYQAMKSFMLRDMGNALRYTNLYMEHFETKETTIKYSSIWNTLYEALITLYFSRETGDEHYRVRGENALLKMKKWLRHSDWNFKNKVLLVEAEFYNTQKEFNKAAKCYEASIKAAQEHKFNPDEAIANELAGIFFYQRENYMKAYTFFTQSIECYKKWGANAVARRVEDSMSTRFDADLMQHFSIPSEISIATLPADNLNEPSSKKRQHDD